VGDREQHSPSASVLDRPDTVARLFLALPVPESVCTRLAEAAQAHFGQYFDRLIPAERWHVTLFFFGEVRNHAQYLGRLKAPLSQAFVPTISLTHIGRGAARDQLWAHITPTPALLTLRESLAERLRKIHFPRPAEFRTFKPHIHLANFYPTVRGMGLADTPFSSAYAVSEAYLYQSILSHEGPTYTKLATISLGSSRG